MNKDNKYLSDFREVMEKYQINNYRIGILSRLQAR